MTPEQRRRVRDLFEAAVDLDAAEATRWIDAAAGDDDAVRRELRSLWEHHLAADTFLARPAAEASPELLEEEAALESGTMLGMYRVGAEIGRGGMGRVYRATDIRLGRDVALKALPPASTADPRHRERLRREARAAAALTHPGICTVYALEELDGAVYIVTELLDGRTLREEMGGQRPSSADILATARALTDAVAAAHERGVVHRDLKPENVMRLRNGSLKVLDFGLARMVADQDGGARTRATIAGGLVGTLNYMAPEQLNGEQTDARTDVFALGVLLYEYATGVHPFAAPTPFAVAGRILEAQVPPLAGQRPDLPEVFSAAIRRALEKVPSARFASARELRDALGDAGGAAVPAAGVTGGEAWWRAHQVVVIALYLVASIVAWQVKELVPLAAPLSLFLAVGCAATVGGVLRGHLVFTSAVHPRRLEIERRRTGRATLVVDLLIAIALAVDGLALASRSFVLYGLLTIALGIGIGLAAIWLEPATTAAAFE